MPVFGQAFFISLFQKKNKYFVNYLIIYYFGALIKI